MAARKVSLGLLDLRIMVGLICGLASPWVGVGQAFAEESAQDIEPLRCIAFSPYVQDYNPQTGRHPPRSDIRKLLDKIENQFDCILTYGTLHGLDATFAEAQAHGLKVIAVIWLDRDPSENARSIAAGIRAAKKYPRTILRLSCGSEVRARNGKALDGAIKNCVSRLRTARVPQPISAIDTWWEVCNHNKECTKNSLYASMDWIGVNVYPWWENKFSGYFTCTTAEQSAEFVIERLQDVKNTYPEKQIILTEFGWPAGPPGYSEVNQYTGEACGIASEANQTRVAKETFKLLESHGWSGVLFESFREKWKINEGVVGPFWGICKGNSPYKCKDLKLDQ